MRGAAGAEGEVGVAGKGAETMRGCGEALEDNITSEAVAETASLSQRNLSVGRGMVSLGRPRCAWLSNNSCRVKEPNLSASHSMVSVSRAAFTSGGRRRPLFGGPPESPFR